MKYGNVIKSGMIMIVILFVVGLISQCHQRSEENTIPEEISSTTIFQDDKEKLSESEKIESMYLETATYPEKTNAEETITPEIYTSYGEMPIECYFTNTETTIDAANALPLYAHASIIEKTQIYLNNQGVKAQELHCIDDSVMRDGEWTSFQARCVDAENQIITLTYHRDSKTWTFDMSE